MWFPWFSFVFLGFLWFSLVFLGFPWFSLASWFGTGIVSGICFRFLFGVFSRLSSWFFGSAASVVCKYRRQTRRQRIAEERRAMTGYRRRRDRDQGAMHWGGVWSGACYGVLFGIGGDTHVR